MSVNGNKIIRKLSPSERKKVNTRVPATRTVEFTLQCQQI